MRFRDDKPGDLDRARTAVREWRERHPQGTAEQLVSDLAGQFQPDYAVVLRGVLFAVDSNIARITTEMTGARPRLNGRPIGLASEEPDQVLRLHRLRQNHPEVIIGDGGFGTFQARVPEPNGETVITRYSLREVLDKLDELISQEGS